jgi:putative phosphoesterase
MLRIGILSDTHSTLPDQLYSFFADCDELWHAGDIGIDILDELRNFKPVVAVYGNTDDWDIRREVPETQLFKRENLKIIMTHIGGYPGHYENRILPLIKSEKPDIFVTGHSHILRVMYDKTYNMLHINPGAAGRQGFHKVATLVRLTLDGVPKDLEICEFDKYGSEMNIH